MRVPELSFAKLQRLRIAASRRTPDFLHGFRENVMVGTACCVRCDVIGRQLDVTRIIKQRVVDCLVLRLALVIIIIGQGLGAGKPEKPRPRKRKAVVPIQKPRCSYSRFAVSNTINQQLRARRNRNG